MVASLIGYFVPNWLMLFFVFVLPLLWPSMQAYNWHRKLFLYIMEEKKFESMFESLKSLLSRVHVPDSLRTQIGALYDSYLSFLRLPEDFYPSVVQADKTDGAIGQLLHASSSFSILSPAYWLPSSFGTTEPEVDDQSGLRHRRPTTGASERGTGMLLQTTLAALSTNAQRSSVGESQVDSSGEEVDGFTYVSSSTKATSEKLE
jgi:hypothetical protein